MNLVFVTEARFFKDAEGRIYGDAAFSRNLWKRYLQVFDHLFIMCRVKTDIVVETTKMSLSSCPNVTFVELPYYVGPLEYFTKIKSLKKTIQKSLELLPHSHYICRVPGNLGDLVINQLIKKKKPYAVEVVGDPEDVFSKGSIKHPLRSFIQSNAIKKLKKNVKQAGAALYVTKFTLQQKYPPGLLSYFTYASNVKLEDKMVALYPRAWRKKKEVRILSIGSLEQMYKSPDILIEAIEKLNIGSNDVSYTLTWLGDGKFKDDMVRLVKKKGLDDKIYFKGNVPAKKVFNFLQQTDLFVLASRTEGLPRAIVEAMGMGLPVIATNVGGIPELLNPAVLVEKNNSSALASKITEILETEKFYNKEAKENLMAANDYKESILSERRLEFYNYIKINL